MISCLLFTVHIHCLIITVENLTNQVCLSTLFVLNFVEQHQFASKNKINKKAMTISYPLNSQVLLHFSNTVNEGKLGLNHVIVLSSAY